MQWSRWSFRLRLRNRHPLVATSEFKVATGFKNQRLCHPATTKNKTSTNEQFMTTNEINSTGPTDEPSKQSSAKLNKLKAKANKVTNKLGNKS